MDAKSFGVGFGFGAGFAGIIFGIAHFVKKRKEEKEADPGDIVNWPDPPAPPENMPEEKEEGEEEEEVPDEHEIFRDLSDPYIPPPPAERSMEDRDIYEINEDEFFLAQGAKKRFFTYYSGDGIMTDESDEPVNDPIAYLGDSVYRYFCNGGKQTIHLRNLGEGCVIEVAAVPELYADTHGGGAD